MPDLRPQLSASMVSLQQRIVDEHGRPTIDFYRMLERLVAMNANDDIFALGIGSQSQTRDIETLQAQIALLEQAVGAASETAERAIEAAEDAFTRAMSRADEDQMFRPSTAWPEVEARPDELTDGRIAPTITAAGVLASNAKVTQLTSGTATRSLGRAIEFLEVQDGDAVTFATNFGAPPQIRLMGGTGLVYDTSLESGGTVNQFQVLSATNVSVSGFTAKAKLRVAATTTARADSVTTTGGGSEPDYTGNKITADEAVDDVYTFTGTISGAVDPAEGGTATIGVYTASAVATWVQRATVAVYFAPGATSKTWSKAVTVDGLGLHASPEFGISLETSTGFTSGPTLSAGLASYGSAAAVSESTATPDAEVVYALVFESGENLL